MEDVGHERLEAHILDAGDELGGLEVLVGGVAATLAEVVDEVLCDLTEGATFFAEVDDDADATGLRGLDALFDGVYEVGLACADVRSKHVRSVTYTLHRQ